MNSRYLIPLLLLCVSGYSQDLRFEVQGKYQRSIHQENALTASFMIDIMTGYPASWITDYISVKVSGTCEGKLISAIGVNDTLTKAQQSILSTTDLGADILVEIAYRKPNAVTLEMETRYLNYQATVIPDSEAQYVGGSEEMNRYLKEATIREMGESASTDIKQAIVIFTVNELGEITDARVAMSSGDEAIDQALMAAIKHMPKWTPAMNADGRKVSQVFEYRVGTALYGC
jgi:TonB family protein